MPKDPVSEHPESPPPAGPSRVIPYVWQYGLAIFVAFAALVFGGVAAQATVFGLSPTHIAAIGIVQMCLTFAAGLLPKIYRPPTDSRAGMD
jgi:hypothetical protein